MSRYVPLLGLAFLAAAALAWVASPKAQAKPPHGDPGENENAAGLSRLPAMPTYYARFSLN
jgi:hypothetical protein